VTAILNIAAYKFVALDDAEALRSKVHAQAEQRGLLGTVLLATEGINLVLAGDSSFVRDFVAWLRGDIRFAAIDVKESLSDAPPFRRLRVKVKAEIIRMNHAAIQPQARRAPAVDASTLARWLASGHDDAGRPVVTLDARNAFEVDHGRFKNAIDWRIEKFSEFPQALLAHREALRGKTVVSYCTGGIRCEKAALFMRDVGVDDVYQLEGGILKYFEATGGQHFEGDCFVFDQRETLAATLAPAGSA
jgi:UPF0176 protein